MCICVFWMCVFVFEYLCNLVSVYVCVHLFCRKGQQCCLTVVVKIDCAGSPKKHRGMLNIYFQIVLQSKGFTRAHEHTTTRLFTRWTVSPSHYLKSFKGPSHNRLFFITNCLEKKTRKVGHIAILDFDQAKTKETYE